VRHSDDAARAKYRGSFEHESFETIAMGEVASDLLEPKRG
jgi:hypothetical protein